MTNEQDIVARLRDILAEYSPVLRGRDFNAISEAAATIEALREELAGKDAEIAAWLRSQAALPVIFADDSIVANIATAIKRGDYRKDGE